MSERTVVSPQASSSKRKIVVGETPQPDADEMTPAHSRALERADQRKTLISLADQVAEDFMHERNFKYPESEILYPEGFEAEYRFVTKFYPYAKGGPLMVDEPQSEHEINKVYAKMKRIQESGLLKRNKLRYCVIEPDSRLDQVLEQMGEL
jgi:hypothetical protein